jgi:hypothetical protein
MAEDAMEKLRTGETNLEELSRTLPAESIYDFGRHAEFAGQAKKSGEASLPESQVIFEEGPFKLDS